MMKFGPYVEYIMKVKYYIVAYNLNAPILESTRPQAWRDLLTEIAQLDGAFLSESCYIVRTESLKTALFQTLLANCPASTVSDVYLTVAELVLEEDHPHSIRPLFVTPTVMQRPLLADEELARKNLKHRTFASEYGHLCA